MTDLPAAGNIRLRVFFTRTTSQSPRLRETLATVAITRGNSRSEFSLVYEKISPTRKKSGVGDIFV